MGNKGCYVIKQNLRLVQIESIRTRQFKGSKVTRNKTEECIGDCIITKQKHIHAIQLYLNSVRLPTIS